MHLPPIRTWQRHKWNCAVHWTDPVDSKEPAAHTSLCSGLHTWACIQGTYTAWYSPSAVLPGADQQWQKKPLLFKIITCQSSHWGICIPREKVTTSAEAHLQYVQDCLPILMEILLIFSFWIRSLWLQTLVLGNLPPRWPNLHSAMGSGIR